MDRINFEIDPKKHKELKALVGTVSEHLRKAVDDYLEKMRKINVSESPTKEVKNLG